MVVVCWSKNSWKEVKGKAIRKHQDRQGVIFIIVVGRGLARPCTRQRRSESITQDIPLPCCGRGAALSLVLPPLSKCSLDYLFAFLCLVLYHEVNVGWLAPDTLEVTCSPRRDFLRGSSHRVGFLSQISPPPLLCPEGALLFNWDSILSREL